MGVLTEEDLRKLRDMQLLVRADKLASLIIKNNGLTITPKQRANLAKIRLSIIKVVEEKE